MRVSQILLRCSLPLFVASTPAFAQVRDSKGNELEIGQPIKPVRDIMGGMIGTGRRAKCIIDDDYGPIDCAFYPRNGDGSFVIQTTSGVHWATKISPSKIDVWAIGKHSGRIRKLHMGVYERSRKEPACWYLPDSTPSMPQRICVY